MTRSSVALTTTSLSRSVILRLSLLLSITGAVLFFNAQYLLNKRFDAFEQQHYQNLAERVASAIEQDRFAFKAVIRDYAYWQTTYDYLAGKTQDYINNELTLESFDAIHLDSVFFITSDRQVYAAYQRQNDQIVSLDKSLKTAWMDKLHAQNFAPGAHFYWLNHQCYLVGFSEIRNNDTNPSSNGTLIFIRHYDAEYLQQLKNNIDIHFALAPPENNSPVPTPIINESHWQFALPLNQQDAVIQLSGQRILITERSLYFWSILGVIVTCILLSLVGCSIILRNKVLKRLEHFSALANQYWENKNQLCAWPIQGHDELDTLAKSLNKMMDDIKTQKKELEYLTYNDIQTKLLNRQALIAKLEGLAHQFKHRPNRTGCLLLVHINELKSINTNIGHQASDEALSLLAHKINQEIRTTDIAARLSGDEFAILLDHTQVEAAILFAERLLSAVIQPIYLQANTFQLNASIGIVKLAGDIEALNLLRNVQLATQDARLHGLNRISVFSDQLLHSATRKLFIEGALRLALEQEQLEVWYQPIMDSSTQQAVAIEALARWKHDDQFISPAEFVPIAENTRLISPLGRWVLQRAVKDIANLRQEHPKLTCNINISVQQFEDDNLEELAFQILTAEQLNPAAIHFEITESMMTHQGIDQDMKNIANRGIHFHLDDFGTGYSSLDRLRQWPFHTLKIDRSFTRQLSQGSDVMVRNIIRMSHDLNMQVIAEGVETQDELTQLNALGCTLIQGFYFAKPMPLNDLKIWLNRQHTTPVTSTTH